MAEDFLKDYESAMPTSSDEVKLNCAVLGYTGYNYEGRRDRHYQAVVRGMDQITFNARLYKALINRITGRAKIIETGTGSYCFRRTLEKRIGKSPDTKS